MLTRLSLCLALVAALGGCASVESRYYDEEVVYRDGDYYVPADADRGDYYYAPDDYGYDDGYRYGYLPYAPYDPSFGFAGFDGYCPVAYAGCLPWWAFGYSDPHFRFWFGYGWNQGYLPIYGGYWGYWGAPPYRHPRYRDDRHDGHGDRDHDRDHGHGDHRDHGADRGPVAPPPATLPRPPPDVSRPAPVERMPRPIFDRWVKDPRPEPVPVRPQSPAPRPRPVDSTPVPSPTPAPSGPRWRDPAPISPPPRATRPPSPPAMVPRPAPAIAPPPPRVPSPETRREGSRGDGDTARPRRPRDEQAPP